MASEYTASVSVTNLANLNVKTSDDKELTMGRLWKNQTAILVFLRHFACMSCRNHAQQVWSNRAQYEKSGGKIIFIGNGNASYIESFKEDLNMKEALVLTDPSLESFKAAGLHHGFTYILRAKTVINAVKLLKNGNRPVTYTKDAGTYWQLGGILAINTRSEILYHYISEFFGDIPDEPYIEIIKNDEAKV